MNRFIRSILAAATALLLTGCADPYYQRLDELQERVDALQELCDQINKDLSSLQALVKAIDSKDMITGITEIRSGSVVTGYRINFVQHESITITNGKDGASPLVSSRQNPDDKNYYWAIRYGDGDWEWLRAGDGTMMLSIGILPYVSIRNGYFCLTFDGVEWTQLGKADGVDGDQMFHSIDASNPDYVSIRLKDGQILRIPTYNRYLALVKEVKAVNDDADTQFQLLQEATDSILYIKSINPILADGDTVGQTVVLSDGRTFNIRDWAVSMAPSIFVKQADDGKLYWAYSIGTNPVAWVLSRDGQKIPAAIEETPAPVVSITRDEDGQYYWTITTGDQSEFLRYKVADAWEPRAIDSVARAFHAVRNYSDSLVVVLKDTTVRFVLPKQYTVVLTTSAGTVVDDTLQMRERKDGDEAVLHYTAYGVDASLSVLAQGGFKATQTSTGTGTGTIRIKAPAKFASGSGKVMAVFTFPGASPVTVIKTITITK